MSDSNLASWEDRSFDEYSLRKMADNIAVVPIPDDLITTGVAVRDFSVSRSTLLRAVKAKTLKSYRNPAASENTAHRFSRRALAGLFPKK